MGSMMMLALRLSGGPVTIRLPKWKHLHGQPVLIPGFLSFLAGSLLVSAGIILGYSYTVAGTEAAREPPEEENLIPSREGGSGLEEGAGLSPSIHPATGVGIPVFRFLVYFRVVSSA